MKEVDGASGDTSGCIMVISARLRLPPWNFGRCAGSSGLSPRRSLDGSPCCFSELIMWESCSIGEHTFVWEFFVLREALGYPKLFCAVEQFVLRVSLVSLRSVFVLLLLFEVVYSERR